MTTEVVDTRHGQLAVTRRGTGPSVLLLHGIPGSQRSWGAVSRNLWDHADVIVPDLLGFGRSAKPRNLSTLHAAAQAEAVLDVLDRLGVPATTAIGHDFGGPVALSLLAAEPARVSGLGLLATNAFTDTPIPVPLNTVTWPVVGRLTAPLLFSRLSLLVMLRTGVGSPRIRLPASDYLGDRAQHRSIATIFKGSLTHLEELYAPVQQALEQAAVPGFVMWGDRDPFFTVAHGRRTAKSFNAPFIQLPQAGHFLPAERPAEVAAAILQLQKQVDTHHS